MNLMLLTIGWGEKHAGLATDWFPVIKIKPGDTVFYETKSHKTIIPDTFLQFV